MRTTTLPIWVLTLVCVLAARVPSAHAGRASWHTSKSPYRASFRVLSKPNHKQGGVAVSVPVCGLAPEDGSDLVAYDGRGNQLPLMPLGKSAANEALALVAAKSTTKEIHVYFGSKSRAAVHRRAFLPSLTADVRTLPKTEKDPKNWTEAKKLLASSKRIGMVFVDKIELTYNPVNSAAACFIVFDGYLKIPKGGTYEFMLVSDDAAYLLIDDKPVLERNGHHWARDAARGECRKAVPLTPGTHKIRYVLIDYGGGLTAILARWINKKNKFVLKPDSYIQPGKTKLLTVEGHYRDSPCPAFWYKHRSYMALGGAQYTETEMGTYSGREAEWLFEDGAKMKSAKVRRIFPGLTGVGVKVRQKRASASGTIDFNELPPKQLKLKSSEDYKRYTAYILDQNLKDLRAQTLRGYATFLKYHELDENLIPICEAIINGRGKADDKDRLAAALDLARAAAKEHPDKSRKAYEYIARKGPRNASTARALREYVEFLLFRQRDYKEAKKIIDDLDKMLSDKEKAPIALHLDLALCQGQEEQGRKLLEELLSGRELGRKQRYAAVKSNALRQRFYDLMKAGFLINARKILHEWDDLAPTDRTTGAFPLARARYWKRIGWLDGALAELDAAILSHPLLPNLPDVEFERGVIQAEAGDQKKANDIFLKIVKEYPNHPVAKQAKGAIK
ncbi:MAG: hypothetical protein KAI66_03470 [Lentisphaeria bacterium]|nr:hypothetical protein [Lentisphaeria bacterium]